MAARRSSRRQGRWPPRSHRGPAMQCRPSWVQMEPPRPLFGSRRQPDGGPSRTGARDGEADDPLKRRAMLLTGASQPLIEVVRILPGRWRLVELQRLWSGLQAPLQGRAGVQRPPGCAVAGTDLNSGFGFVAGQRCSDDRRIRDVHQLIQAKLTDHPRLVAVGRMPLSQRPAPVRHKQPQAGRMRRRRGGHRATGTSGPSALSHTRVPLVGSVTPMPSKGCVPPTRVAVR